MQKPDPAGKKMVDERAHAAELARLAAEVARLAKLRKPNAQPAAQRPSPGPICL